MFFCHGWTQGLCNSELRFLFISNMFRFCNKNVWQLQLILCNSKNAQVWIKESGFSLKFMMQNSCIADTRSTPDISTKKGTLRGLYIICKFYLLYLQSTFQNVDCFWLTIRNFSHMDCFFIIYICFCCSREPKLIPQESFSI